MPLVHARAHACVHSFALVYLFVCLSSQGSDDILDWKAALHTRLRGYRHYILDWKDAGTVC